MTFDTKFGKVYGVNHVDVNFRENVVTGIIGETGSGKSLLGMSILKLLSNEATVTGQCFYKGQDHLQLDKKNMRIIRGKEIGLIPQNPDLSLNPVLTIQRQITEILMAHNSLSKREVKSKSIAYLKDFGFAEPMKIMKSYPFQLSGGMNQRILCIICIICNPNFIIADEPTKGLDSKLRKTVYENLIKVKQNYTKSMIVITHDLYFANKFCDEIIVMYKGEIVEKGRSHEIIEDPKHPYTKGLIGATLKKGMIPIQAATENNHQSACKFYNRCSKRTNKCFEEELKMRTVGERHVRCHYYD